MNLFYSFKTYQHYSGSHKIILFSSVVRIILILVLSLGQWNEWASVDYIYIFSVKCNMKTRQHRIREIYSFVVTCNMSIVSFSHNKYDMKWMFKDKLSDWFLYIYILMRYINCEIIIYIIIASKIDCICLFLKFL